MTSDLNLLATTGWSDYALLDSGRGRKLERFGKLRLVRPEPQALWQPSRPEAEWESADAFFDAKPGDSKAGDEDDNWGRWRFARDLAPEWPVAYRDIRVACRFTAFRHVGLFPEQAPHWDWVAERKPAVEGGARPKLLNLFAYTGAASLVAAAAGYEVTHVDSSKKAIAWAKENQAASGLTQAPIRWICEDARTFIAREVRRGAAYDGVVLDPPSWGHGPNGQAFSIDRDLGPLLGDLAELLGAARAASHAGPVLLTCHSPRWHHRHLHDTLADVLGEGGIESGRLACTDAGGRTLALGDYARWTSP